MESLCCSWGEVGGFSGVVGHKSHVFIGMCCILQNERQKDREGKAVTENIVVR